MQSIKPHRWAATLLSTIVTLALTGNAMAAAFCPHMSGRQCYTKSNAVQPEVPAGMDHQHMHHAEMPEMEMDMAGAQIREVDASLSESENVQANNDNPPALDETTVAAITLPNDRCSHCMMHSRTTSNYLLRAAIENSPSYQILAAEAPLELSTPSSPTPGFVEVHDHGPPGSSAPLYVLVSSFRI
jgi:hypothetical protein